MCLKLEACLACLIIALLLFLIMQQLYSHYGDLTQTHAKFQWLPEHQAAYEKIKNAFLTTLVMLYYDIDKQTVLAVDASPFGVTVVLGQQRYDSEQCNIAAYEAGH